MIDHDSGGEYKDKIVIDSSLISTVSSGIIWALSEFKGCDNIAYWCPNWKQNFVCWSGAPTEAGLYCYA
jgi:hypothetical protein